MHGAVLAKVPALYKIFDEILVNAADNAKRDAKAKRAGPGSDWTDATE